MFFQKSPILRSLDWIILGHDLVFIEESLNKLLLCTYCLSVQVCILPLLLPQSRLHLLIIAVIIFITILTLMSLCPYDVLLSAFRSSRPVPLPIPAVLSQNVTNKSYLVCV